MSDHAAAAHPETSTGLDSRKLAIWTFIGSECLFFATLISNYLVHKETWLSGPGPFPHDVWKSPSGQVFEPIIEIPLVTLGTALLLFSSLFVVLALASAQRGNRRGLLLWLGERHTQFRFASTVLLHDGLMYVSLVLLVGHLYLAVLHPATRHALRGITLGSVDEEWAAEHHSKWTPQ